MNSNRMCEPQNNVSSNTPSIVVIDDEPAILASMTSLLRRRYTIHVFESAQTGLDFLRHNSADIIISDMRMPGMGGREFFEHLTATNANGVRIMMSGYEDKEVILDTISKGIAQYYIFKPWDDGALRETIGEAIRFQNEFKNSRLREILKTLITLPSPPRFQTGMWALLSKPEKPVHELAEEIEHSPALVAKLLRVANSVFFGARQHVSTTLDAIKLVGTQQVVSMAISIETFGAVGTNENGKWATEIDLIWERSLRRAQIAKGIGSRWEGFHRPHELYIAALLQDIGIVIQICHLPKEYSRYRALVAEDNSRGYAIEQEIFGITHDKIGEAVLEYWHFPKSISEAIGKHHGLVDNDDVTILLQIANALEGEHDGNPHDPILDNIIKEWNEKHLAEQE